MNGKHYILDEQGCPVAEPHFEKWLAWMRKSGAHTLKDEFGGCCRVVTIFGGIDQNSQANKYPKVWETRITGGPLDGETRYSSGTIEAAKTLHELVARNVKACCPKLAKLK